MARKIELLETTIDENGHPVSSEVVHPLTSADCVVMENGATLDKVMGDGIATPTVTHESASFQVGVGDSNIEVVDGDVAGMTLEGKSYHNILPKPTTLIMETEEKEFKINDKIDNNIVLDDNIAEIATVKGQTYVNVVQEESATEYTVLGEELSGKSITTTGKPEGIIKGATLECDMSLVNMTDEAHNILIGGAVSGATNASLQTKFTHTKSTATVVTAGAYNAYISLRIHGALLKPSTAYFVRIGDYTNSKGLTIKDAKFKETGNIISTFTKLADNVFKVTTNSEFVTGSTYTIVFETSKYNQDYEVGDSWSASNIVVCEYQEGMETWNIPYFDGIGSVKSPKLLATGKNLFDGILKQGYIGDATGEANTSTVGVHSPNYIKVKPNTTYTRTIFGNYPSNIAGRVYFYDINKTYLNSYKDGATFVTPVNAQYMRFRYHVASGSIAPNDFSESTIQIEEGSTATSYEPYKGVTIEQDIDSIPLTSDMFEQNGWMAENLIKGMSLQQMPTNLASTRVRSKSLISVKPNSTYILNGTLTGWALGYNKNGGYVSTISNIEQFTTTSDIYYITPILRKSDNSDITPSELSSLNLTLQEVPQEIVLRSLPNGVKDTLNLTTGEYIQRIGEVVLDGSRPWNKDVTDGGTKENTSIFYTKTNFNGFKPSPNVEYRDTMTLCDKLPVKGRVYNLDEEGLMVNSEGRVYIRINLSRLEINNVEGFKTFLANNNIKIVCELATPIIHKVNLTNTTKLPSYASTTHYDTIVPSNSLIPTIKLPSTIDYNVAIKPSTRYTVRCNTTNALSVNLGGSTGTLSNGKVTLTTPSTLAHNSLKLGSSGKAKEVMVIEGSEIKDNVPFFNGMKNVQMGGIKLVNVARGATCNSYVTANANKTQFTYTADGSSEWGYIKFDGALLKPNTKYTIYMNIITITSDNSTPIKIECGHEKRGFTDIAQTGTFKKAITTISKEDGFNEKGLKITFRPCTSGGQVVIQNPMIIEGDWTHLDEIPYIESEMIIEQPIIRSTLDDGVEPFKHQTLYSNRVIGYEEGIHYVGTTGAKATNADYNSVMADVEGLSVVYVTNGSSNYSFWDKDEVYISGKSYLDTKPTSGDNMNGFITVPSNAKYMKFASGNTSTSLTDYTKATVTGELHLRSLPNGVCDTLNLVTGEYVQRVGEVILDGVNVLPKQKVEDVSNDITSYFDFDNKFVGAKKGSYAYAHKFNYENYLYNDDRTRYAEGIRIGSDGWGSVRIFNSRLETVDKNGFIAWLKENPITVQYELETPIVRKIGLTAKGNYKEITLNGSENWISANADVNNTICTRYYISNGESINSVAPNMITNSPIFSDYIKSRKYQTDYHGQYEYVSAINNGLYLQVYKNKLLQDSISGFKQWLSQHHMKVGYLTSQSATTYSNILKPIFFNNVKVQFMNNNIDIQPVLTLQARSRNSYVMDMMKANTRYTLKALKNSNSFTIDGTSYGAGTNDTFTSPATLTNKLMITGQDVQELMIIEGDVTSKTLPYFKGIRGLYDNVDEIEIYSVGKNIFDINTPFVKDGSWSTVIKGNSIISTRIAEARGAFGAGFRIDNIKPNTKYILSLGAKQGDIYVYSNSSLWGNSLNVVNYGSSLSFTTNPDTKYITIGFNYGQYDVGTVLTTSNIQLEESSTATPYQQHQHNTTLIPMPTRLETVEVVRPELEKGSVLKSGGTLVEDETMRRPKDFISVEPNMRLVFMNENTYHAENVIYYDINKNYIGWLYTNGSGDLIVPNNCYFIKFYSGYSNTNDIVIIKKQYKPIALNTLPNGVKDELTIDPTSNKAKLIQRVGKTVFDGQDVWGTYTVHDNNVRIQTALSNCVNRNTASQVYSVCDKLPSVPWNYSWLQDYNLITVNVTNVHFQLADTSLTKQQMLDWLKQNPITVYYELETPVTHEVCLSGFPFVYKNGSMQLNTDIPHPTMVKYNVNQEQLIHSQNETIIRHDKQIDDLFTYIELYLNEVYQMELFKMQLELSL